MLVAIAVGFRLMPYLLHTLGVPIDPENTVYPWNFSPILPLCIFGAACFARRTVAYLAPLAIYLAGDLGIWAITGRPDWAFYADQPVTYFSVILVVTCGFIARSQRYLGEDRRGRTGFGSAFLRRFEFRDLGARHDLREDLGRTGGVLRDGGSVLSATP